MVDVLKVLSNIGDFKLIEYANTENANMIELVGLDTQNNIIRWYYGNNEKKYIQGESIHVGNQPVVNIVTKNYIGDKIGHLVVAMAGDNTFTNKIYNLPGGEGDNGKEGKGNNGKEKGKGKGKGEKQGNKGNSNNTQGQQDKPIDLGNSTGMPLIITDPKTGEPKMIKESNGKIKVYKIKETGLEEIENETINSKFAKNHSSCVIDLGGILKPNLVLHTAVGNEEFLEIYEMPNQLIQKIKLTSGQISNIQFYYNHDTNSYDLMYISEGGGSIGSAVRAVSGSATGTKGSAVSGSATGTSATNMGKSILNLHRNQRALKPLKEMLDVSNAVIKHLDANETGGNIYNETPDREIDLEKLFGGKAVIRNQANNQRTGIFLCDIENTKAGANNDVVILMKINGEDTLKGIDLSTDGEAVAAEYNSKYIDEWKNAFSISTFYNNDLKVRAILVNTQNAKSSQLKAFNLPFKSESSTLNIKTAVKEKIGKFYHHIDTTYYVIYNNGTAHIRMSLRSTSSIPSLQPPSVYLNLINTNLFVTKVLFRTNRTDAKYESLDVTDSILPNTSVVFESTGGKWVVKSYFLTSKKHIFNIMITIVSLLILNLIVLALLTIREGKRYSRIETKREKMLEPLFNAL